MMRWVMNTFFFFFLITNRAYHEKIFAKHLYDRVKWDPTLWNCLKSVSWKKKKNGVSSWSLHVLICRILPSSLSKNDEGHVRVN